MEESREGEARRVPAAATNPNLKCDMASRRLTTPVPDRSRLFSKMCAAASRTACAVVRSMAHEVGTLPRGDQEGRVCAGDLAVAFTSGAEAGRAEFTRIAPRNTLFIV